MTKILYLYYNLMNSIDIFEKWNKIYRYKRGFLVRVISGKSRGKKLVSLDGDNTRPTLDRVKEAMFNKIQFNIKDATVLDLFAGTGALGIEALSRGAKETYFCDKVPDAINVIKQNVTNTNNIDKAVILNKDYNEVLEKLKKENKKIDIVFLDPPYKTNLAIESLQKIIMSNLLTEDGIVIIETDDINKEKDILKIENVEIFDKRKYGSVWLIFIRKG